jgi:hypothetical protein
MVFTTPQFFRLYSSPDSTFILLRSGQEPRRGRHVYDTTVSLSRRAVLHGLKTAGAGLAGLRCAAERTTGDAPDGVPLVRTRDRFGAPREVTFVPKERRRRLAVYRDLDLRRLTEYFDGVRGLTMTQRSTDPTDLALTVFVDRLARTARRTLPSRLHRVPVELAEYAEDPTPGQVCRRLSTEFFDPVRANVEIEGRNDENEWSGNGTLGVVAWDATATAPTPCLVTAHHVVGYDDGRTAPYLVHEGATGENGRRYREVRAGRLRRYSQLGEYGLDVAKYEATGTVDVAPLTTASSEQPDLAGSWDFAGLADATTRRDVPVTFAGRSTCYAEAKCVGTSRTNLVGYQADIAPCVVTHGDSGGPFLDERGNLLCTFSTFCEPCERAHGPVGTELLSAMRAQLFSPAEWNAGAAQASKPKENESGRSAARP